MIGPLLLKPALARVSLPECFSGTSKSGRTIGFDSLGLHQNDAPIFGVSGEVHYARLDPQHWEEALYKAKAGGVTIISTYVFWIFHEEIRGVFDFTGRRNLRRFVELCKKHGLSVILRVGPFCHGEVRNGGFPDWLYGMPFRTRSTDGGFLYYTKRLYAEIAGQVNGLLFEDDGPVVGIQLDNEYMHSSAIWELTRGTTNEYVFASDEGDAYLKALHALCQEVGLRVPFYTCTAWGGAACWPDACLPLWGGYSYMPWTINRKGDEHPLSEEYLYRDAKSAACSRYHSYNPTYDPSRMPFACCEMGPGMEVSYQYRFIADPCCADAMANVKAGSGCNFVGYYMYQGGTNPVGNTFLNEDWCPHLSYDYQAPLGENLQPRESYFRLRALHQTLRTFQRELSAMSVSLPDTGVDPSDLETLRYSVRSDGERGFVFLNNFQDHATMPPRENIRLTFQTLSGKIVTIPHKDAAPLSLASGESCVLPFGLTFLGATLESATAQILFFLDHHLFCLRPEGMTATLDFGGHGALAFENSDEETRTIFLPQGVLTVTVFSRAKAHRLSLVTIQDRTAALWTDAEAYETPEGLAFHGTLPTAQVKTWPMGLLPERVTLRPPSPHSVSIHVREGNQALFTRDVELFTPGLLRVLYEGDAVRLYQNGRLVSDHFFNGAPWEVPTFLLNTNQEITLVIVPVKENVVVSRDAMAAIKEDAGNQYAKLLSLEGIPLYQTTL